MKLTMSFNMTNRMFAFFCLGVAVILIVAAAILIIPALTTKAAIQREIVSLTPAVERLFAGRGELPGKLEIDSLLQKQRSLRTSYREIMTLCLTYDDPMERWFADAYKTPETIAKIDGGWFKSVYETRMNELEHSLLKLKQPGRDFAIGYEPRESEAPPEIRREEETADPHLSREEGISSSTPKPILQQIQKRFWMRDLVCDAIKNSKARVSRLEDIVFPDSKEIKYAPATKFSDLAGAKSAGRDERSLLKELGLGETITFAVSLQISYADIPHFLRYLQYEAKPAIPELNKENLWTEKNIDKPLLYIDIKEMAIALLTQNHPSNAINDLKEGEKPHALVRKHNTVHPVRLVLVCEVLDFDRKKIRKELELIGKDAPGDEEKKP